ncbi:MAG: ATP-binding protein, partial [Selenomonadaceae bacterium]|nr:ATP-binding protein [Selenomonadaceae bacterium]
MTEVNLGITLVEIVTSGLYKNSLDIIREYIQNSCDAIDDAVKVGILREGEEKITVIIDEDNRSITIEDNGTGISALTFQKKLSDIGKSDKSLESDRGFRGIGRLGGLAYCKTLIFSSKVAGEKKISTLIFNAEKLRQEFWKGTKRSAESVLIENMKFETFDAAPDTPEHFFRVEMIDIVDTNKDLLDVAKVREYLSFVAPVTYSPQFYYQELIYKYAAEIGFKITEYKIEVDGEQLVKNYKSNVRTKSGEDEIFGVEFRDLYDADGKLIAWLWFGLSTIKGILSEAHDTQSYKMRGLRMRSGNIQIGDAETLKELFKEDRGWKYFIGEIHAVDKNLRPNSKRDDFEEDKAYNALKAALKTCFVELEDIYRAAANVRTEQNKINAPDKSEREFKEKSLAYQKSHEATHEAEMLMLKKNAAKATDKLEKFRQAAEATPETAKSKVVLRIIGNQPPVVSLPTGTDTNPQ